MCGVTVLKTKLMCGFKMIDYKMATMFAQLRCTENMDYMLF